ncbi:hypothetical protein V8E52_010478 [Russula decolorans]
MPKSSKSKSKKSGEKGPKGWTTPEQYDWLQAQIPTYLSEKADGTRPLIMFWAEFFDGWFERWPEESNDVVDAQKLWLRQWFNNHTRGMATAERRRTKPLNLIKRQTRKLSSAQAYSRIYYEKMLKPLVEAEWTRHIASNPGIERKPGEFLRHRNIVIREIYNAETDEVKAEVEKRHEDGLFSEDEDFELDDNDGIDAVERQRHTKAVNYHRKCTLEGALKEIEKECGFVGFIVVGGPEPKCASDLMIMSAHTGTNGLGSNFTQAYGGWKSNIEEPFIAHLNKVFTREKRQEFALPGTTSTQDLSAAHDHQLRSRVDLDATKFTGNPEIGLDGTAINWRDVLKMLDNKNLYTCGDTNSGSGGGEHDSQLTTGFDDVPGGFIQDDAPQEGPSYRGQDDAAQEDAAQEDVAQEDVVQDDVAQEDVAQEDVTQEDVAQKDVAQEDVAQEDVAQEDVTQEDFAQEDVVQDDVAQEDVAQDDVAQEDIAQDDVAQEDFAQEDIAQDDISYSAQEDTAHILTERGDWPPWLVDGVEYMQSVSTEESWVALIMSFVKLEKSLGFIGAGRIDAKNRPNEVGIWLKNGRKSMKQKITNIVKYKASWQTWWQGLQPKWRLLKDGTFLQKVPDTDEEWEALQRGGPNGFFIIVLAFAWWAEEAKGKNDTGLLNALDDMTWVIRRMADMPATPSQLMGAKHALEDEPDSSKKKHVFSVFGVRTNPRPSFRHRHHLALFPIRFIAFKQYNDMIQQRAIATITLDDCPFSSSICPSLECSLQPSITHLIASQGSVASVLAVVSCVSRSDNLGVGGFLDQDGVQRLHLNTPSCYSTAFRASADFKRRAMVPPVTIQKVIHIQSSRARLMLRYSSSLFINLYPRDLEGTHAISTHSIRRKCMWPLRDLIVIPAWV